MTGFGLCDGILLPQPFMCVVALPQSLNKLCFEQAVQERAAAPHKQDSENRCTAPHCQHPALQPCTRSELQLKHDHGDMITNIHHPDSWSVDRYEVMMQV